jgi:hypothetical protein
MSVRWRSLSSVTRNFVRRGKITIARAANRYRPIRTTHAAGKAASNDFQVLHAAMGITE